MIPHVDTAAAAAGWAEDKKPIVCLRVDGERGADVSAARFW